MRWTKETEATYPFNEQWAPDGEQEEGDRCCSDGDASADALAGQVHEKHEYRW